MHLQNTQPAFSLPVIAPQKLFDGFKMYPLPLVGWDIVRQSHDNK